MAEAQIVMSSIGMMGNASSTINALNFKSSTTCIDVQSGVAVLNGQRGNGMGSVMMLHMLLDYFQIP